jgi:hypothetical protein
MELPLSPLCTFCNISLILKHTWQVNNHAGLLGSQQSSAIIQAAAEVGQAACCIPLFLQ